MQPRSRPAEMAPSPWPDAPADDPIAETARVFVTNLVGAIGSKSIRSVARASGVNHVTLQNIMLGKIWPDLATIARLERGTETPLWPGMSSGEFVPRVLSEDAKKLREAEEKRAEKASG
jgi:hypothetical protein